MEWFEIVLLILGIGACVAGFVLPSGDAKGFVNEKDTEEKIKKMVDDECDHARIRLQDITEETVTYSVEKAERSLERLTNEKMMALGEYSDTIMTQNNKNHQETVFMYDMLTNSREGLSNQIAEAQISVREINNMATEARQVATEAAAEAEKAALLATEAMESASAAKDQAVIAEETMLSARKNIQEKTVKKTAAKAKSKPKAEEENRAKELVEGSEDISIQFAPGEENGLNNNEKILKLHKQGKSNMAIAKELGLGIGEVKLVIDLFEKK